MSAPDDDPYFITPEEESALELKSQMDEVAWPIDDEGYVDTYYAKGKDGPWLEALSDKDFASALTEAAQDLNDTGLGDDLDKWMPFQVMIADAANRIVRLITSPPVTHAAAWMIEFADGSADLQFTQDDVEERLADAKDGGDGAKCIALYAHPMTAPVISAGDLVARLDKAVDRCKAILANSTHEGLDTDFALMAQYRLSEAAARIQELETGIEAARQYGGGGFFGPFTPESIRDIYRQQARSSLNQDGGKP